MATLQHLFPCRWGEEPIGRFFLLRYKGSRGVSHFFKYIKINLPNRTDKLRLLFLHFEINSSPKLSTFQSKASEFQWEQRGFNPLCRIPCFWPPLLPIKVLSGCQCDSTLSEDEDGLDRLDAQHMDGSGHAETFPSRKRRQRAAGFAHQSRLTSYSRTTLMPRPPPP